MEETAQKSYGGEITADVGLNEGALGIVSRGYVEKTRCLDFRVNYFNRRTIDSAVKVKAAMERREAGEVDDLGKLVVRAWWD